MRDALARARRFRSRAQEFQRLADTCGSPEFARHYCLIGKHFFSPGTLGGRSGYRAVQGDGTPTRAPLSRAGSKAGAIILGGPGRRLAGTAPGAASKASAASAASAASTTPTGVAATTATTGATATTTAVTAATPASHKL